jgi:hypothetical protein
MPPPQRLRAIACEVLYREFCLCVARSRNVVDLQFASQGLHDLESADMCERLQCEVDAADPGKYDVVVLGYALCNNGIVGLRATSIPLVIPRAHDCITLFFGSRQRYREYFDAHPGAYYHTTGWLERDKTNLEDVSSDAQARLGLGRTYAEYVARYGEDNARYLMATLGDVTKNYDTLAYIDMGFAEHTGHADRSAEQARQKGWTFERLPGDLSLLQRLVDGDWDAGDFLVVPPGQQIATSYSDSIIETSPCE